MNKYEIMINGISVGKVMADEEEDALDKFLEEADILIFYDDEG